MPTPGSTPADLSPQLDSLLLRSGGLLALAAVLVGLATWLVGRGRIGRRWASLTEGPADDRFSSEPSARRYLRWSLGLLWILDGLLQAQPRMAAGFIPDVIEPGMTAGPSWLRAVVEPLARTWTRHPVAADAVTVWVQVGLGLLILLGGVGRLRRTVLWFSLAWSVGIWVVGEFFGGLLQPGASWLVGAPGAALAYAVVSLLLLAPWPWWTSGRCTVLIRRAVGAWMLAGAVLQALPWEGFWSADGLAQPFRDAAQLTRPSLFGRPITALAHVSAAFPVAVNVVLIVLLGVIGLGLCLTARPEYVIGGITVCALTWWLGQGFGVFGGTATDPNTAFPLALLLTAALPRWAAVAASRPGQRASVRWPARWAARRPALRQPSVVGLTALGIGAVVVAPLVVTGVLLAPGDAAAVAADSGGGVVNLAHRPAPDFSLTDQAGRAVSIRSLRGKLTLVTFLDPVCSDECPLIADQLALADADLGPLRGRVEIVAVDSNPVFASVSDVVAFTQAHGLDQLPNWHFVAGSASEVQQVLAAWGMVVAVPAVGMIEHSEGIYFVLPDGSQAAYLPDGANADLTGSYADQIRDEVRSLLK